MLLKMKFKFILKIIVKDKMNQLIKNNIERHQICNFLGCKCGRWHYVLVNGIETLSKKIKECHPVK